MSRKVMQQALGYIKDIRDHCACEGIDCEKENELVAALEAKLAKPEPVNRSWLSKGNPANAPVRNSGAPPKPEQEPVRWFQQFGDAPPRKPWVGLTREEIVEAYCSIHVKEWAIGGMDDVLPFTRAIEAKLKEKNT